MKSRLLAFVATVVLSTGLPALLGAENELTAEEKAAGWRLLFDGRTLQGWSNFRSSGIKPGWQVRDGQLVCVDPHNAGDIVTADKFGAFELQIDFKMGKGANSGIMFHVADSGQAAWATGPEIQLEDNANAGDPQKAGWLYALYQPPLDPATGKTLDTTRGAGEWNHLRIVISPQGCLHEMNGTRYVEYVLGSDDFKARVAKSKFGKMPGFATAGEGRIALQGDHGEVSFRNIKIRALPTGK